MRLLSRLDTPSVFRRAPSAGQPGPLNSYLTPTNYPGMGGQGNLASKVIPVHVTILGAGERKLKLAAILLSQHLVMSHYPGSRRGSAPPPYSLGPFPNLPSPARILYHRNPGYGHATPPNAPDHRHYESEHTSPSHSEGTRRRRGIIPPYDTGGKNDLKRPSRVFPDHRPSTGSTLYEPPEKHSSHSPPLGETGLGGIDGFKDEDEINFNILRQHHHQFLQAS